MRRGESVKRRLGPSRNSGRIIYYSSESRAKRVVSLEQRPGRRSSDRLRQGERRVALPTIYAYIRCRAAGVHGNFTFAAFSANRRNESERRTLLQSGMDRASITAWSRSTYLRPLPSSRWNRLVSWVLGQSISWSGLLKTGRRPSRCGCLSRPITRSSARLSDISQHSSSRSTHSRSTLRGRTLASSNDCKAFSLSLWRHSFPPQAGARSHVTTTRLHLSKFSRAAATSPHSASVPFSKYAQYDAGDHE